LIESSTTAIDAFRIVVAPTLFSESSIQVSIQHYVSMPPNNWDELQDKVALALLFALQGK
jgi:hypothetical protein